MKIYLSVPTHGIADKNKPAFDAAAKKLRDEGHEVFNPADFSFKSNWKPSDHLAFKAAILIQGYSKNAPAGPVEGPFDAIAQLPGWKESKDARIENFIADELGLKKIYLCSCGHKHDGCKGCRYCNIEHPVCEGCFNWDFEDENRPCLWEPIAGTKHKSRTRRA